MEAIRKIVQFDNEGNLNISLGKAFGQKKAEVIFLLEPDYGDITEEEWLRGLSSNPVFDFLKDPAEDIYTLEDGKPYTG